MRLSVSILALFAASAAQADDLLVRADLARATVYPGAAEVVRTAAVTVPAGSHRLLIALPGDGSIYLPEVTTEAALTLGPLTELDSLPVAEGALDTPAQATARAALEQARDTLQDVQDRAALADAAIRAANLQIAHLEALARGGPEGATMPDDPGDLGARLAAIGTEMTRVSEQAQTAQIARRALNDAMTEAQTAVQAASFALSELAPFGSTIGVLALDVVAEAPTEAVFALSHATDGVDWRPSYEMRLDSESGALEITRFITLDVQTGEVWTDVDVTFSADNPNRTRETQVPQPDPARIFSPSQPAPIGRTMAEADGLSRLVEEAPAVMAEAVVMQTEGLAVSYAYQSPVSVGPSGRAILPFDELDFEADLTNRAVPRRDATAFLMASMENDSGGPLLPGDARFYRDGALVGEGWMPLVASGAEVEMGFGPLDHLPLTWQDLSLDEGDRGIFVQSNTQTRRVEFSVENTSDEAQDVRLLYATPFAEQEDLEVDLSLSPAPDETDVDGLRGVAAWNVTLQPGETRTIEMSVEFDWPDGQFLGWRP